MYLRVGLFIGMTLLPTFAQAGQWEKILTCDGGAAVIDTDTGERRSLQLVIRNTGILKFLNQRQVVRLNYGDTEAVFPGRQNHGVFSPTDFQYMVGDFHSGYWYGNKVYVNREGRGLKARFVRQVAIFGNCTGDCKENPLSMQCESACSVPTSYYDQEMANWFFQNCD